MRGLPQSFWAHWRETGLPNLALRLVALGLLILAGLLFWALGVRP